MKEKKNWLWVGIDPRPPVARVLVRTPTGETLLKARLRPKPHHPRALATLLESLALWQGVPARAALAVGEKESWCGMGDYQVGYEDFGATPLYSIETVVRRPRRPHRDPIRGMGDFRDTRQLWLFGEEEVGCDD